MATIGTDNNGRRRILFVDADGRRKTVRLGKSTAKAATHSKLMIELLVDAKRTGRPNADAETWAEGVDAILRGRLQKVGLVKIDATKKAMLGDILAEYFSNLDVGPRTLATYRQTRKSLETHFGAGKLLSDVGPLEAERWKQASLNAGLAPSTVAKRVRQARTIFKHAIRWRLATSNPFAEVQGGSMTNRERMFFVTREMADSVFEACPNTEWKLIFALSRYGGLRCPSEHALLTWEDIDWEKNKIRIHSPKTERHGGAERFIPVFPELRELLMKRFEDAEPGEKMVVPRVQNGTMNIRTRMLKIIKRAGLSPWPKLMHNLRSSRQTELAQDHPAHVVCSWLGNSPAVASAHYLQVTDSDFEKAAQNPAQYRAEQVGMGRKDGTSQNENRPVLPSDSEPCLPAHGTSMTPRGVEPLFAG